MFKLLLTSVVIVPVLLGMQAATRGGRRGLFLLLTLVIGYAVLYMLMLYYLRFKWLG